MAFFNYEYNLYLFAFFIILIINAPVAQLDRVPDFESVGCRFESCQAHSSSPTRGDPCKRC